MDFSTDIIKIKDLLDKSPEVLIATHERPTADSMGSALALYLGLVSLGKKVTVACPDPMIVEFSNYVGANKVVSELGKKNFVISLDYVDGSIEKVSYNIEGDKFNLVVEPRPGFETFNEDKVHFSHAGSAATLIFTVDTIHLGGLKKVYENEKELFAGKPVINVDRHPNNAHYGHTNMVNPQASSTAELVAQLLAGLGVKLTQDIATNILNALYGATNSFQNPNVTATALELAAACMKVGGKRFGVEKPLAQSDEATKGRSFDSAQDKREEEKQKEENVVQPTSVAPAQTPATLDSEGLGTHEHKEAAPAPTGAAAPPDWLKPKIFRSGNLG